MSKTYQSLPLEGFKWIAKSRVLCANVFSLILRYDDFKYTPKEDIVVYNRKTSNVRHFYYDKCAKNRVIYKNNVDDLRLVLYLSSKTNSIVNSPESADIYKSFLEEHLAELIEPTDIYL